MRQGGPLVGLLMVVALGSCGGNDSSGSGAIVTPDPAQPPAQPPEEVRTPGASKFPLTIHPSGRYLVDAQGNPWRIQADAAWLITSVATPAEVELYLDDRAAKGFNSFYLMGMVSGDGYEEFAPNAPANYLGHQPFTTTDDFTTPNEPYWQYVDWIIDAAAERDMAVLFAFNYLGSGGVTQGWAPVLSRMTEGQAQTWGAFIGNRYKGKPNIMWGSMGDHTPPARSRLENNVVATIRAIRAAGATQPWWGEPSPPDLIPTLSAPAITTAAGNHTNSFYGLGPACNYDSYKTADRAYRLSPPVPAWMQEGPYESNDTIREDNCGRGIQDRVWYARRARFWSVLAGGTAGDGFGSSGVWSWVRFPEGLQSPGSLQSQHAFALVQSIPWWQMRPSGTGVDFAGKTLVTSGRGNCTQLQRPDLCMTSAVSADGGHLLAYFPGVDSTRDRSATHTFSIDMTAMAGPSRARWWNPTTGAYTLIGTYPNTGTQSFTTPGSNGAGNDWIIHIDSSAEAEAAQ